MTEQPEYLFKVKGYSLFKVLKWHTEATFQGERCYDGKEFVCDLDGFEVLEPDLLAWELHRLACVQCKKAGLGRFAGATTEQINGRRCEQGKSINAKAFDVLLKKHAYREEELP